MLDPPGNHRPVSQHVLPNQHIPGLTAVGQAQQIEAGESQEHENDLQKTRNRMDQAQTDQPQGNRNQQEQVQKNRAAKRQQEDEINEDHIAYQAHETRNGRKLLENNKYQRLNRYERSRCDVNVSNTPSANNINQEDTTLIPRKPPRSPLPQQQRRQQQRRDIQEQRRITNAAAIPPTGNASIGFASESTYELPKTYPQAPQQAMQPSEACVEDQ